jgi:hypothetical protein
MLGGVAAHFRITKRDGGENINHIFKLNKQSINQPINYASKQAINQPIN